MRITGARLRQREGLWDIEVGEGRISRIAPRGRVWSNAAVRSSAPTRTATGRTGTRTRSERIPTGSTPQAGWSNLLVLDAATEQDAVRFRADVLYSMHRGRGVFRRRPASTTWAV